MLKLSPILFVFLIACNGQENIKDQFSEKIQDSTDLIIAIDSTEAIDSIAIWYQQSQKELDLFNKKYQIKWSTKTQSEPKKFPWKTGKKILVYYVAGEGEKQATWECRTSSGKQISQTQYEKYCELLNKRSSYNNTTAACFIPKLSVVVYDEENIPMEYSEVCLDCNSIISIPHAIDFDFGDTDFYGLSAGARQELRKMFAEWNVPYESYSKSWDSEEEYQKHLNSQKAEK